MNTLLAQLLNDFPFVTNFVKEYGDRVAYAGVKLVSADMLNGIASARCDNTNNRSIQRNVFFLDNVGRPLYRVVPSEHEEVKENHEGPRGRSVGRQLLALQPEIQLKIEFILVQEWEIDLNSDVECHHIDITLYRSPSRYGLYEFVEELSGEIVWLHLDRSF